MELGHLFWRNDRTYEDHVGQRGLDRLGRKRWRRAVAEVAEAFRLAVVADYVVLGGGNAKLVDPLPPLCRRGNNELAFRGGVRLWERKVRSDLLPAAQPG
jgi:polyphosphate glucokinase